MRAISDYLAKEFAARRIPPLLDHRLVDGQQRLTFENLEATQVFVSPFASDAEIQSAVFKAFAMTDDNIETAAEAAKPATVLPPVNLPPAPEVNSAPLKAVLSGGGVMAKGYKRGSLKAMLDSLHQEGQSIMEELADEAAKAKQAHAKLRGVKSDLRAYCDGIIADLGSFTNFPDDE